MKTGTIRQQLLGAARSEFKSAAGNDTILSKVDEKKLPADLKAAVAELRKRDSRVTVNEAVDAYAAYVSKALDGVDTRNKGDVSKTEAKAIADLALRSKVLDIVGGGTVVQPGPVNALALASTIEDLQSEWGDANIMDGHLSIQSTVVRQNDLLPTIDAEVERLKGDAFDSYVSSRIVDGPRSLKRTDVGALARAINDDGLQYESADELPAFKRQLDDLLKKLGGPDGLQVAVAKQQVKVDSISDTDAFALQVWSFRNPVTNDAVSIAVRKGSL